jgi:hypothetical protein
MNVTRAVAPPTRVVAAQHHCCGRVFEQSSVSGHGDRFLVDAADVDGDDAGVRNLTEHVTVVCEIAY